MRVASTIPSVGLTDAFHPLASTKETSVNLAALAVPPPGTGTGTLDALTIPQPLNTRRTGAPTLPSFELPPPNFQGNIPGAKYTPHGIHPPSTTSVGNLLTPPATNPSGDSTNPLQPASTSVAASSELPPSYAPVYWQGQTPYSSSGAVPRQPWAPTINTSFPPLNHFGRNPATSPPVSEGMSQPYDMNQLPPFQQTPTIPSPGVSSSGVPQPRVMTHAIMGTQGAPPNPVTSPHPLASNDPYAPKSQPAPIYGGTQHIPSPHQAYPPPPPPYPQAGLGIQGPGRVSAGPNPPVPSPPSHLNYPRQPYPSYSLPAMSGPVLTNVHSPNSQMSLIGGMQPGVLPGFNSGHVASMQQMYGGHPPPLGQHPGPTNDRPFKCDQCPQSFNRNHDLKRHKRIHLSVKPFPCTHCEKSFSRKDALKVRYSSPGLKSTYILTPLTATHPSQRLRQRQPDRQRETRQCRS